MALVGIPDLPADAVRKLDEAKRVLHVVVL